jgi:hypothetical protein
MVLFAGPIFPEWFDGVFFALVFAPIPLATAIVADLALRRRLHGVTRAAVAAGIVVGVTLLGFSGRALIKDIRFERHASAVADRFTFIPYQPDPLPAPFVAQGVNADDEFGGPALVSRYVAGAGAFATAYQQQPGAEVLLQHGHCSLRGLVGPGGSDLEGPCRLLRSANGIPVFIGVSESINHNVYAVLDGTLIRLFVSQEVGDRDLLAYFDSLRPVAKEAIEFTQAA